MIEVAFLDSMGTDLTVVQAARVSFAKSSEWEVETSVVDLGTLEQIQTRERLSKRDAKLISYLAEHNHWAPFSHPQVSFHVKAPIFVRAQCFKHKVGFAESEISRRYVDSEPEFYLPNVWRGRPTGGAKQGSAGEIVLTESNWKSHPSYYVEQFYFEALRVYQRALDDGVAPEQARMVLPQAAMTEWRWTGSLAAWARFCHLRLAPDAQGETREVASLVAGKMADLFPISWAALAGWRAERA